MLSAYSIHVSFICYWRGLSLSFIMVHFI